MTIISLTNGYISKKDQQSSYCQENKIYPDKFCLIHKLPGGKPMVNFDAAIKIDKYAKMGIILKEP